MEEPQELVSLSAKILPKHLDFLEKFDKTNQSNALDLQAHVDLQVDLQVEEKEC